MAALLVVVSLPATARADGFLSPFVGVSLGGELGDIGDDESHSELTFGAAAGWMGNGILGFELDFAHSPDFFAFEDTAGGLSTEGNLTTLMANIILGAPIGGTDRGVRPYVSGGVGLIRSRVNDVGDFFEISNSDFGVDLGGGVMGFFTDNVGLRGDIRYFRALVDENEDNEFDISLGDFDFWRATAGLAFRF
jgi:opacity protein-like surface antigen